MKTGEVQFRFPVLGLTPDLDVWGFPDLRGLTTCGPLTLKNNMQRGLELIDADGRRYGVQSVRRVGRAGPLALWLLASMLSAKPQSKIEHELQELEPLSLAEIRERVCAAMEAHPLFWCEPSEKDTVLPARQKEVRSASSIAEIHEILGLDTFESY
jgi:hypothetical protein